MCFATISVAQASSLESNGTGSDYFSTFELEGWVNEIAEGAHSAHELAIRADHSVDLKSPLSDGLISSRCMETDGPDCAFSKGRSPWGPIEVHDTLFHPICAVSVPWKFRYGYDDSLDVLWIHGIGGVVGVMLLGCFVEHAVNVSAGNARCVRRGRLFDLELRAAVVTVAYAFGFNYDIAELFVRFVGLHASPEDEFYGLDLSHHGETAFSPISQIKFKT